MKADFYVFRAFVNIEISPLLFFFFWVCAFVFASLAAWLGVNVRRSLCSLPRHRSIAA
jgi:hypothetical protein